MHQKCKNYFNNIFKAVRPDDVPVAEENTHKIKTYYQLKLPHHTEVLQESCGSQELMILVSTASVTFASCSIKWESTVSS